MPTRTLGDLVADVRTELDRGTIFDDAIRRSIRRLIQLLRSKRLGFNEKRLPLTINAELVTLDPSVLEVTALRLDTGSSYERMIEKPANWILSTRYSKTYASEPIYFAAERNGSARQLRLYPQPDKTYSAEMVALVDLATEASLSSSWSDNTTLAWFDDAYLVLLYGALIEVNSVHVGSEEAALEAKKLVPLYDEALKQLTGEVRQFQHSDSILPCM